MARLFSPTPLYLRQVTADGMNDAAAPRPTAPGLPGNRPRSEFGRILTLRHYSLAPPLPQSTCSGYPEAETAQILTKSGPKTDAQYWHWPMLAWLNVLS